jgi:predicted P-loop ATPase
LVDVSTRKAYVRPMKKKDVGEVFRCLQDIFLNDDYIPHAITSDMDKIRRPYARTASEYSRRTVFVATVNEDRFLIDSTGNSRFWTLPVVEINYEHGIDMQQLFAQLVVDFNNGAIWWLSKEDEKAFAYLQ